MSWNGELGLEDVRELLIYVESAGGGFDLRLVGCGEAVDE